MLELANEHCVPHVKIRRRGIKARLHSHGVAGLEEFSSRSRSSRSWIISAAPFFYISQLFFYGRKVCHQD